MPLPLHRRLLSLVLGAALALPASAQTGTSANDASMAARVDRLLKRAPLIIGHNDLAWELQERYDSDLSKIDLSADTSRLPRPAARGVASSPGL